MAATSKNRIDNGINYINLFICKSFEVSYSVALSFRSYESIKHWQLARIIEIGEIILNFLAYADDRRLERRID